MMMVIIALIPCLLFGIYNTGHWQMVAELGNRNLPYWGNGLDKFWNGSLIVLPLIVVSYGVGLGIEFLFGMLRGHSLHEGFLVSGISVESPYTITLGPIDREDVRQSFELVCDTIHEMRCLEFLYAL